MGLHAAIPSLEKKSGLKPTQQNPPMICALSSTQKDQLQGKNHGIFLFIDLTPPPFWK
jgi:hypothetical protein